MIPLRRLLEQQGMESPYYDLGRDFSNFKRTMDTTNDQIKQRFEQTIGSKLNGKRIRARASKGYKQYVKDYELDVTKVTLDDYYDNYVVVAHDNSTPKSKEYFLKPGFKIQILGQASGQPSMGDEKEKKKESLNTNPQIQSKQKPVPNVSTNTSPQLTGIPEVPNTTVKEGETQTYDAYSVDDIYNDIKRWVPKILLNPEIELKDYINGLGWARGTDSGSKLVIFDLKIPVDNIKHGLTSNIIQQFMNKTAVNGSQFQILKVEPNRNKDEFLFRIKKITK